ncbi:hypothetical protein LWI28_006129 [Acer negundo]|uniref:RPW8 domain-containing protein n=1 Tax=Acer negundo TaxID=4023 RepID=A0AAD5NLB5_ACENE|nr:hypothetical protein LWI28_006129 [Acer negundo]
MAELIGGAMLGAVFGELLKAVIDAKEKSQEYESQLNTLKSTLENITPAIQETERLNGALDIPAQETAQLKKDMKNGEELVRKCSEEKFCCFKRVKYAGKLSTLNQSIERFIKVNLQAQMARDNKKILEDNKKILEHVEEIRKNTGGVSNRVKFDGPCLVPDPPEITPGLDAPLKELRTELVKDEGKQVIVVSGHGGLGKTTLVQKLCADNEIKDKFQENIFFVTVSKTPDVMVIVKRIFQHMKCEVPTFQTDEAAINDLERLLKCFGQKAILLVLDDVWSGSLVQKFKFRLPNYKILVTSRDMFLQFGSGYLMEPLDDEAAMILFRSSVTPQDREPYFFDENLAQKILKYCKRSPLALTVIGRLLCGKPAAVWQSTVKEWDEGNSIFISGNELLECLQSSLDALDEEVKECYLDLGSFPEDQRIPITALIDMWMELHEWVEDGLSAIKYLHQLSDRCMVKLFASENASDDGYYNDYFIIQHALLRELIIHQSKSQPVELRKTQPVEQRKRLIEDISENKFPKWWSKQKQNPIHARLLSISTDETFSSCWYDINAPEVEVLVLNLRTTEYTLPNFIENMGKLKVLIVTNYGFQPVELSNYSLLGSHYISNLKRIRLEHISIPSFGVQMNNLQKISLVMCNVGQAFKNSNFKISNAFPNLLEFGIDYCDDLEELPDGLCDIVSLKKLNITNCHKLSALPEDIGKLVNLEELRLVSCTELSELPDGLCDIVSLKKLNITNCHKLSALPEDIGKLVNLEELRLVSCTELSELPEMVAELSNLKLLDISGCLRISKLTTQVGKLRSLETLCMIGCSSCRLPPSIKKLERLNVVKCDKVTASQWEPYKLYLPKLKVEVLKDDINLNWLRKRHF